MLKTSNIFVIVFIGFCLFVVVGCQKKQLRFTAMQASSTGIKFANNLNYTEAFNPYTYRNFYNGGGVAMGDINNDGLIDIYFTGNLKNNALYLNQGNFKFKEIAQEAGVACEKVWSTGATFVDINQDGWLDLYVCKSGMPGGKNRHNELFINQKDNTFKEAAATYGLDITGLSVQAAFFDYDRDGDLDCYLLNNSIRSIGAYDLIKDQRDIPDPDGNRLLENRDGFFVNVSEKAGIYSSKIGFGLGITLSDFNNDHWPDLFISNDFFEKDYLYLNHQKGGFTEMSDAYFNATSMGSMGADAVDIDNDLQPDLMVTEMLPETLERRKLKATYENWDKQQLAIKKGYGKQFPRNVLQRNMGQNGFAEISRSVGLEGSEWSWAALFFDMDNDGLKDLYISNGITKDLLDRDYLSFMANDEKVRQMIEQDQDVLSKLIEVMPSEPVPNAVYKNTGAFTFKNTREAWGFNTPSFSNGSAYGDLDNDGDLDIVVNNINHPAFVYRNNSEKSSNHYLQLSFKGPKENTFAIGAKAIIYYGPNKAMLEQFPSRGFQSAVSNRLHFGLGTHTTIDSLAVYWPNQKVSKYYGIKANQHLVLEYQEKNTQPLKPLYAKGKKEKCFTPFAFKHQENKYIDFNSERLLPQMYSNEGPIILKGDVNQDGTDDFYIGGAKNQSSQLWVSRKNKYELQNPALFAKDLASEDTEGLFLDIDQDGDLDLYVGSGGKAFSKFSFNLHDRIYLNNGKGNFSKQNQILFKRPFSTGAVTALDIDKDGDQDLFVGERFKVETYGLSGDGFVLINNGKGNFTTTTPKGFKNLGMITGAKSIDINKDGWEDLVVVGEWMGIKVFINNKGSFEDQSEAYGLKDTEGLWSTLEIGDLNQDGYTDLIVGNIGNNSFYKPYMRLFVKDFDANGRIEQIMTYKEGAHYYPILDKDELIMQIPTLKKKFLYYKDYAKASYAQLFGDAGFKNVTIKDLKQTHTSIFWSNQNGFSQTHLAPEIQYANVSSILVKDVNLDGAADLILGGNQSKVKPQFGAMEASKGWVLINKKNSIFETPKPLGVSGEIRALSHIKQLHKQTIIIGINNDSIQFKNIQ